MTTKEGELVDVYIVDSGLLTCAVVGREASVDLCNRIERLDPWRGIPFTKHRPMSYSEALRTMQELCVKNTLDAVKREA